MTKGPASMPAKIPHMFERYFSSRPEDDQNAPPSGHAGLGLWIVRRNVETLGGRVGAANRIGGGLSISISCRATARKALRGLIHLPRLTGEAGRGRLR